MLKRVLLSSFIAVVICGVSFYVAYSVGLIYIAATGPLNPANAPTFQSALRHVALPVSITLGIMAFIFALRGLKRRELQHQAESAAAESRRGAKFSG